MAIEGPVRELALSDLLQLLYLSRRTGDLIVRDDATGVAVVLEIAAGTLAGATSSNPESRLGHLLVGTGRATDVQVQKALVSQRDNPDLRLGEILVEGGEVRAAEVERQLRFQVEETVFDLMRWEDGQLRFEERPGRSSHLVEVRLPTDIVLMDAVRRLDEWAEVTATAPDTDPLPRLAPQENGSGPPLSLQPLEWEVLAKVDGGHSLRKIARSLGRGELEVARAIYSLASAGIVELGPRAPLMATSRSEEFEKEIRAVDAAVQGGRLDEAEHRLHALLEARPASAGLHVLRGRLLALRQQWEAAIRTFDRAIEIDPLLPTAYFHMARAAVRLGDLRRAGEALLTYRRLPDGSSTRRKAAERMISGIEELVGALKEGEE